MCDSMRHGIYNRPGRLPRNSCMIWEYSQRTTPCWTILPQEMSFAWNILHQDLSPQLKFPGLRWLWRGTTPRSGQFLRGVDISTYPSGCLQRTCHDPLQLGLLVPNRYLVAMWLQNLWRSLKLESKTWLWSICLRTHITNRSNRRSILENLTCLSIPRGAYNYMCATVGCTWH
jgi:hypothetical protein